MRSYTAGDGDYQAYVAHPKLTYFGINARNLGNTPATVTIHNGISNAGPILATVTLQPKQSYNDWPEPGGMPAESGIYVARSGSTEVAVYFRV